MSRRSPARQKRAEPPRPPVRRSVIATLYPNPHVVAMNAERDRLTRKAILRGRPSR